MTPADRTEPLKSKIIESSGDTLTEVELAERQKEFKKFMKEYWEGKLTRGWKGAESVIGRYIPTINSGMTHLYDSFDI